MHQTKRILFAVLLGGSAGALSTAACGSDKKAKKKGCAKLVEQLKDCHAGLSLKGEDTDERTASCKKRLAAKDPVVKAALPCANCSAARVRCGVPNRALIAWWSCARPTAEARRSRRPLDVLPA